MKYVLLILLTWFLNPAAAILLEHELVGGDANGTEFSVVGLQVT